MANRFKRGSGCYTCVDCGKRTRATGRGDNEHVKLCEDCYDRAGDENSVADGLLSVEAFKERWGRDPECEPFVAAEEEDEPFQVFWSLQPDLLADGSSSVSVVGMLGDKTVWLQCRDRAAAERVLQAVKENVLEIATLPDGL